MTDRVEIITSRQNSGVLDAIRLKDRRERWRRGEFFFEGRKLFAEALARNLPLRGVFCTAEQFAFCREALEGRSAGRNVRLSAVSEAVYEKLTEEKAPEGIFCIGEMLPSLHVRAKTFAPPKGAPLPRMAILDGLQDPGNLGTVLRTAAAFGIERLLLSADCADPYHKGTVRASMGALFSLPLTIVDDLPASMAALREEGALLLGAALTKDALSLKALDRPALNRAVFVIGSEGRGLRPAVLAACDRRVLIPMTAGAESLNAAAAAAVLFWQQQQTAL